MKCKFKARYFLGLFALIPFLCLFARILYVNSITREEKLQDIIASNETCFAPCWQNLTPGISTVADLEQMIEKGPSYRYIALDKGRSSYWWQDLSSGFSMSAGFTRKGDRQIRRISFSQNPNPERSINLNTVIDNLGEPDVYTATYQPHVHYIDGLIYYTIDLFYKNEGVVVSFSIPNDSPAFNNCMITLTNDLPIDDIALVQPIMTEQEMLDRVRELWAAPVAIQEWDGSLVVEAIPCYPPGFDVTP